MVGTRAGLPARSFRPRRLTSAFAYTTSVLLRESVPAGRVNTVREPAAVPSIVKTQLLLLPVSTVHRCFTSHFNGNSRQARPARAWVLGRTNS
jgi:hypothetical protein